MVRFIRKFEIFSRYLLLLSVDGLASFDALGDRLGGEAALVVLDDHLVTVDGPLGRAAESLAGQDVLLELGQERSGVADTENGLGLFLQALFLDAAEFGDVAGGDVALASGGVFQLVGDVHQIAGDGALARASQVGDLVAGLGSAEAAETAAVDGRAQDDDFVGVGQNADHVGDGRVDFDKVIGGLLDDGQDFVLGVLDDVRLAGDGDFHSVDLDLLLGSEDFDLFLVEQNGDDLLVVFLAGEDGELVAAGAILGEELVAAGEGGVVEEAVEGGDGLGADDADAGGGQNGAGNGHALGQDDLSDGVDVDAAEESVGVRLEDLDVHGADQRVVDGLDGDLVGRVHHVHLVVGHVGAQPVAEDVVHLGGHVGQDGGHLVPVDGHDGLVQDGGQTAGSDALVAHRAALSFLFAALALLPLGAQSRGDLLFAAGPGGLRPSIG